MNFWKYLRWLGSLVVALLMIWAVAQQLDVRTQHGDQALRPVPMFR